MTGKGDIGLKGTQEMLQQKVQESTPLRFCKVPIVPIFAGGLLNVTDAAAKVFLAIAAHTNGRDGIAWPSVDRIAEVSGKSRATVIRAVRELADAGLVMVERSTGRGNANRYTLSNSLTSDTLSESGKKGKGYQDTPVKGLTGEPPTRKNKNTSSESDGKRVCPEATAVMGEGVGGEDTRPATSPRSAPTVTAPAPTAEPIRPAQGVRPLANRTVPTPRPAPQAKRPAHYATDPGPNRHVRGTSAWRLHQLLELGYLLTEAGVEVAGRTSVELAKRRDLDAATIRAELAELRADRRVRNPGAVLLKRYSIPGSRPEDRSGPPCANLADEVMAGLLGVGGAR